MERVHTPGRTKVQDVTPFPQPCDADERNVPNVPDGQPVKTRMQLAFGFQCMNSVACLGKAQISFKSNPKLKIPIEEDKTTRDPRRQLLLGFLTRYFCFCLSFCCCFFTKRHITFIPTQMIREIFFVFFKAKNIPHFQVPIHATICQLSTFTK